MLYENRSLRSCLAAHSTQSRFICRDDFVQLTRPMRPERTVCCCKVFFHKGLGLPRRSSEKHSSPTIFPVDHENRKTIRSVWEPLDSLSVWIQRKKRVHRPGSGLRQPPYKTRRPGGTPEVPRTLQFGPPPLQSGLARIRGATGNTGS